MQILSLLKDAASHGVVRNGIVVRIAGDGVIDECVVDSARIIDFLASAEKIIPENAQRGITAYKNRLIRREEEKTVEVKSDKIVIVHIGLQNRYVEPIQISYKRIKPYDDIGMGRFGGMNRYDEKVSKECYDDLVDKITKLSFTNPETCQDFDGTFKVKIYKQGKKVFEEVVTVDRLDDFLTMMQRVMKRHDEKKSSIKLLREDFSGVLDIGFQKRLDWGFPGASTPSTTR